MQPGIIIELQNGSTLQLTELAQTTSTAIAATITSEVKEIEPGHLRFLIRNPGPTEWDPVTGQADTRVFFKNLGIAIPAGWNVKHSAFNDAHKVFSWQGLDCYVCVFDTDRKPVHPRVVESQTHHFLEGGESIWWDAFKPSGDAKLPSGLGTYKKICLELLGAADTTEVWPRLRLLKSLYTMDVTSLSYSSPSKNLGWWMLWQHIRHTQGRTPPMTGYHNFGSIAWADGHSNHNYDPERYCVENCLKTGDQGAWELALILASHKAQHGFTWTDHPGTQQHRWRYEKSSYGGKVGDFRFCESSHEWDMGFAMVACLSQDPGLLNIFRLRGESLLRLDATSTYRYWGIRKVAWHLENLYTYWKLTDDIRFKNAAAQRIKHCFDNLRIDDVYWPEDGDRPKVYPWQDGIMATSCIRWMAEDVGLEYKDRLELMVAKLLNEACEFVNTPIGECLKIPMILNLATGVKTWQGPSLTSFVLPVTAVSAAWKPEFVRHHEAAKRSVAGAAFQGWSNLSTTPSPSEMNFDCSEYGYGAPKILSNIMWGARDICLSI